MPSGHRLSSAVIVAAAAVVATLFAVKVFHRWNLLPPAPDGVRSATAAAGRSPYTTHAAVAVGAATAVGLTLVLGWVGNRRRG